jgi:hypothetical protein
MLFWAFSCVLFGKAFSLKSRSKSFLHASSPLGGQNFFFLCVALGREKEISAFRCFFFDRFPTLSFFPFEPLSGPNPCYLSNPGFLCSR